MSASVTATQPTPGCSTRNGSAISESGWMPLSGMLAVSIFIIGLKILDN